MIFNDKDRKTLSQIGRASDGRELVNILNRAKNVLSQVDDITGDYAAQVEGRKLFKQFALDMIDCLQSKPRQEPNKPEAVDYT
jgi:hypothetical protein